MTSINESARNENFSRALSYELVVFADSLVPSKDYIKDGKKAFHTVSLQLLETSAFAIKFNLSI